MWRIINKLYIILFVVTSCPVFGQTAVCTGAKPVPVNGGCVTISIPIGSGTIEAPNPPSCVAITGSTRDYWFSFQATNSTATISLQSITGSLTKEIAFVVYNAPCTAGLVTNTTELACVNNVVSTAAQTESVVLSSLTIGNVYFIRAFMFNGGIGGVQVKLCIDSPQANDEPTSSIALPLPSSSCSNIVGNVKNATNTICGGLAAPSCGNFAGSSVDVWYSATVPGSGNLFFQATSSAMSLMGIAAYTGTPCSSLTEIACSEGNPEGTTTGLPVMNLQGLTGGSTVYLRVWNQNGQTPGTFSICATTNGPCGNIINLNDYCEKPYAIYTSGATSTMVAVGFTGTPIYTEDSPGDLSGNSCSAVTAMQNSWYSFIATSSSVSIPVTTSNCEVDVELFSVSTNTYGCCKNFTHVSGLNISDPDPCAVYSWSVAANSSATITSTALTPGLPYYMMVNYPAGACNFSVTGWAYSGVLPIDLISFTAVSDGKNNVLDWLVGNESSIYSYVLESSEDGLTFNPLGVIIAKGNKVTNTKYNYIDEHVFKDVTYYRIKQNYKDGSEKYTNTISVYLDDKYDNIYNIYPNPTNSDLNFEYYLKSSGIISVKLLDYTGKMAFNMDYTLTEGKNSIVLPMNSLSNGVYILKVLSQKSGKATYHKIIKN